MIEPSYSLTTTNSAAAPDAKLSAELPWNHLDAVPQAISDEILWAAVHGANAQAPPPGPDASPAEEDRAIIVRELLRQDPNVFRAGENDFSSSRKNCPITWACRASADPDG